MIKDEAWSPPYVSTTSATAASTAEAIAGTSTAKFVTPAALAGSVSTLAASVINPRAPRQALALDGTTGAAATLASAIGSGATTFALKFRCPTSTPAIASGILCVGDFASQDSLEIAHYASDRLVFAMQGAGGGDYSSYYIAGFSATYGGKVVDVVFTRSGTTIAGYVNGAAVSLFAANSGSPLAWDTAVTSTTVLLGKLTASNYYFPGTLAPIGIYNRALSAAEVLALYEQGAPAAADYGAAGVPASNTSIVTGDNSTFASDTGFWTMIGGTTIGSGAANFISNSTMSRNGTLTIGKRYRVQFALTASGGTFKVQDGATFFLTGLTTGAQSFEFTASGTTFGISSVSATGTVDNLVIYPIGLLCAPEANAPGNGLEWLDVSGNRAHIVLPTSGVAWALPSQGAIVIEATTNTATNQQLGGASLIDTNKQWRIQSWTVNCSTGTPTISLGNVSAGAQYVSAAVLAAGNNDITLLTRFPSTANLWCNSSTTATLIHRIVLVPAN